MYLNRVRNNGRSSVMTGRILGITCQIIVIHTLCPVIHSSHIHSSLLHYIIISVIIDDFFLRFIYFLATEKYFFALRDDAHVTSMKISQFSRTPNLLSSYFQNSFTHLTSDVQFQTKRKHNPRTTIACYQVFPSGRLLFLVSTH